MKINDELNIHDDAFKNYLWVKLFDDDVFAIIKSHCSFYWATPKLVSFRGLIQNLRRASLPLLYESTTPPPPPPGGDMFYKQSKNQRENIDHIYSRNEKESC